MEETIFERNKGIILASLIFTAFVLFIILGRANPSFVKNIPILGKFFSTEVTANATNNTAGVSDTPDAGDKSSFTVGSSKGPDSVAPLTGSHLNPTGAYKDGPYTGFSSVSTGVLILKITITNGTLHDISFITLPKDAPTDVLQSLAAQAIKNQVVEVSPVNGYDDISRAFNLALANAVQKAFKI